MPAPKLTPTHVREVADRVRAQLALGDDPRFQWLCDRGDLSHGKPKSWQPELLGELGRLAAEQSAEAMRAVALELCELRPSAAEALDLIQTRRGAGPDQALTARLIEVTQQHRGAHPELSDRALAASFELARAQLLAEGDGSRADE